MQYQSIILESNKSLENVDLESILPEEFHPLIQANNPDLHVLNASGKASIDDIRALSNKLQLKAVGRGEKLAIIANAETLGTQSQNALLKLLEEPPKKTLILLVTRNISGILNTIQSRSHSVRTSSESVISNDTEEKVRIFLYGSLLEKEKIIDKLLKEEDSRTEVNKFLSACLDHIASEAKKDMHIKSNFGLTALKTAIQNTNHSGSLKLTLQTLAISMN